MNILESNPAGQSPQQLRRGRVLHGGVASFALLWALAPALVALLFVPGLSAQSPIAYTVFLSSPEQHLVQVQIDLPPGPPTRELQLPVWNALYQVRDFSQYVDWVRAKDRNGKPLAVRKLNNSLWQIDAAQDGATVEYQIYVDSPGPFGAQLNSHQ